MTQDAKDWIHLGALAVIVILRFAKWRYDWKWFESIEKRLKALQNEND